MLCSGLYPNKGRSLGNVYFNKHKRKFNTKFGMNIFTHTVTTQLDHSYYTVKYFFKCKYINVNRYYTEKRKNILRPASAN